MADDPRSRYARDNAMYAGFAALLMLYYGFHVGLVGYSDSAIYNTSVSICDWTMKIGGIALAAIAVGGAAGIAEVLAVDAVVSLVIGASFLFCGLIWLLTQGDWEGLLFIVFGGMFLNAARGCWNSFRGGRQYLPVAPVQDAGPPRPVHPAAEHPEVLPKADEPPPAEGYLARLAREKRNAPRADHE